MQKAEEQTYEIPVRFKNGRVATFCIIARTKKQAISQCENIRGIWALEDSGVACYS